MIGRGSGTGCHRLLVVLSGIFMEGQANYEKKKKKIPCLGENLNFALPEYQSKTPSERASCSSTGLYEIAVYKITRLLLAEYTFRGSRAHCLLL